MVFNMGWHSFFSLSTPTLGALRKMGYRMAREEAGLVRNSCRDHLMKGGGQWKTVKRRIQDTFWRQTRHTFLEDWARKVITREETRTILRVLSQVVGEILGWFTDIEQTEGRKSRGAGYGFWSSALDMFTLRCLRNTQWRWGMGSGTRSGHSCRWVSEALTRTCWWAPKD